MKIAVLKTKAEKQPLLLEVDKDLHISIMDIGTEGFKSLPEVNSIWSIESILINLNIVTSSA